MVHSNFYFYSRKAVTVSALPRSSSGAQPELMHKTKSIIRAFIIVPMLASSLSMNSFTASIQSAVLAAGQSDTVALLSPEQLKLQKEREEIAAKIDAYYTKYDLPLAGYGMTMVLAGEKYSVDPYLIAGLAMRESTGGKFACYNNPFGWGSCKIKFQSFEEAINVVARHLGGHDEKTARYYAGKDTRGILQTYNPPSIVLRYADEVMGIMKKIETMPV